jgi:ribosomal protein L40E
VRSRGSRDGPAGFPVRARTGMHRNPAARASPQSHLPLDLWTCRWSAATGPGEERRCSLARYLSEKLFQSQEGQSLAENALNETDRIHLCQRCSAPVPPDATRCQPCGDALAQRESIDDLAIPGVTIVDPALQYDAARPRPPAGRAHPSR